MGAVRAYAVEPGVEELDGLLGAGVAAGALAVLSPGAEGAFASAGAAAFPDSEALSEAGVKLFDAYSFTYHPAPLKLRPGAVGGRSSTPPHSGHSLSGSAEKFWIFSKRWPHWVQR